MGYHGYIDDNYCLLVTIVTLITVVFFQDNIREKLVVVKERSDLHPSLAEIMSKVLQKHNMYPEVCLPCP